MGLHSLVRTHMNRIMDQASQEPPQPIEYSLLPKSSRSNICWESCSNNISNFNVNWKISDLTETNFPLELIKGTPARTWKYFTLTKFWPKGISYF